MNVSDRYLIPDWPVATQVKACVTLRTGGYSKPPYTSFNLGFRSGDDQNAVVANRQLLSKDWSWSQAPQWLEQVHGVDVVTAQSDGIERKGDAVWTDQVGLPCAVLTADCLPVIFTNPSGTKVAAAHAGWKGLVAGVLEQTIESMGEPADELIVWMGPAISQSCFEVGPEVREQFVAIDAEASRAFKSGNSDRWYGDLYQLARLRLAKAGVKAVSGGDFCTFSESERWFSYRREGAQSGRLATIIWIEH